jgi:hypothetical protein
MKGLRRPIQTYVIHGLWIVMAFSWFTINTSNLGKWILGVMTAAVISFAYVVIKRNYFEVSNGKLIINEGIFRTKTIILDGIEKVDVEPSPFSFSKIILKDKTIIKYQGNQTNYKELSEFMAQFNIPVE